VQKYITNPGRQINLATTVISSWYTGALFLGAFLIAVALGIMVFKKSYSSGQESKRILLIIAWIGFAMMLFGVWSTINAFYGVVAKINNNIKAKKGCSLFQFENPVNAINIIASEATKDTALNAVVQKEIGSAPLVNGEYSGYADASTNSRMLSKEDSGAKSIDVSRSRRREESSLPSSGSLAEPFSFGHKGHKGDSLSTPFLPSPTKEVGERVKEANQLYEDFKKVSKHLPTTDIEENAGKFIRAELRKLNIEETPEQRTKILEDFLTLMKEKLADNIYDETQKQIRKGFIDFLVKILKEED